MASTETNTLLFQLPVYSRIITPDAIVYMKTGDGVWRQWTNPNKFGPPIQLDHRLATGTQAFHPADNNAPRFVKYYDNWLLTRPDSKLFAQA